jgi:hypothetical protein
VGDLPELLAGFDLGWITSLHLILDPRQQYFNHLVDTRLEQATFQPFG